MTEEKLLNLIQETNGMISAMYKMLDTHTGLTEDQVMRIYSEIDEQEVYLEDLVSMYEKMTGDKLNNVNEEKGKYLFNDMFDKSADFLRANNNLRQKFISGNARIAMGKFRTDKESQDYIDESLERELP